jgi:hypothetical protein
LTCSGGAPGTLLGPGAAGDSGCSAGSAGSGPVGGGGGGGGFGAGGGGYFGGGAGACCADAPGQPGSGGGGGSDYPDPASPPAGISNVTVTDGVQSGNGLITVTYTTIGDLLSSLKTAVDAVAPKSSLAKQVKKIDGYIAANNTAKACKELKSFIKNVNALAAKKKNGISASVAASLVDMAKEIESTLGC